MNACLCESQEAIFVAGTGLVRRDASALLQRVAPLVREQDVQLDLGSIERIDAAGISALVSLYTSSRNAGHSFGVCNVSPRVAEVLDLVGLGRVLLSHNVVPAAHSGRAFKRSAA